MAWLGLLEPWQTHSSKTTREVAVSSLGGCFECFTTVLPPFLAAIIIIIVPANKFLSSKLPGSSYCGFNGRRAFVFSMWHLTTRSAVVQSNQPHPICSRPAHRNSAQPMALEHEFLRNPDVSEWLKNVTPSHPKAKAELEYSISCYSPTRHHRRFSPNPISTVPGQCKTCPNLSLQVSFATELVYLVHQQILHLPSFACWRAVYPR